MTREEAIIQCLCGRIEALEETNENIKLLGEEHRKVREGITDEKVLTGFNMGIAICNKHLGEVEE